MLTKGDDYPVHQTAEPVAFAGTDRNFYDRYFFNGYSPDGSLFFAGALGVYPHLNIMDAAFSVVTGGVQHCLFASRIMGFERMDTHVDPITVSVLEPLHRLRLDVAASASGLAAELVMTGRAAPIEEPRFTRRVGTRTLMDVTRLTQNVDWSGWVAVAGVRHEVAGWWGTRDRSWGVRPIGVIDPQPPVPMALPQFYWLWAPLNFSEWLLFWHTNDEADGSPWNRSGKLVHVATGQVRVLTNTRIELAFKPGTRHAASATLFGDGVRVELVPDGIFFMKGIGYGHPERSHGRFHGTHSVHDERLDLAAVDEATFDANHIQALVRATLTVDGTQHDGRGVLEQLVIGPHAPSGFSDLFDLAQ
jgi:hypothetical protein